ncbi:MAG: VWA domain-containing protein, partial [Gammaproteobacteria bacterium]
MLKYVSKGLFILTVSLLVACNNPQGPYNQGVYMLIDTSGTYTQELSQAQQIINFTLSKLNPGDSFAVARVDTASFSEKNIVHKQTFDERPSMTNQQKRAFRDEV